MLSRPKKLLSLLNPFNWFQKNLVQNVSVELLPYEIGDFERIARIVFSPINFKKTKPGVEKQLNSNIYKPPVGSDEISVNRLEYASLDFCKKLGLGMQNPNKKLIGIAVLCASEIKDSDFEIVYTPKLDLAPINIYHSDIKIGYVVEANTPLPSIVSQKARRLTELTRLYCDEDLTKEQWMGVDKQSIR